MNKEKMGVVKKSKILLAGLITFGALTFLDVVGIIYFAASNTYVEAMMILSILGTLNVIVSAIFFISNYRLTKKTYYEDLLLKTSINYTKISDLRFDLVDYTSYDREFKDLNDSIHLIEKKLGNAILFDSDLSINNIKFDYVKVKDNTKEILTRESFVNNLPKIIEDTFCFRSLVLIIRYDTKENVKINDDEILRINKLIKETFNGDKVFLSKKDDYSLYAFVGNIDSLSSINYLLNYIIKDYKYIDYSISKNTYLTLKISAVIYPYSNVSDLLSDLYYADKRSSHLSIYLPSKINHKRSKDNQVLRLANLGRFIEDLVTKTTKIETLDEFSDLYKTSIINFAKYLDFNATGMIYSFYNHYYEVLTEASRDNNSKVFGEKTKISDELIEALKKIESKAHVVYFSKRNNVSPILGEFLDTYHITSGFFYLGYLGDKLNSISYFLNKDKDLFNDFIDKEYLLIYSLVLKNNFNELTLKTVTRESEVVLKNVLKTTNCLLYEVNPTNHKLFSMSDGLMSNDVIKKRYKEGECCYKTIYNAKEPCKDCPLNTGRSKKSKVNSTSYLSTLKLTVNRDRSSIILMEPVDKDSLITKERFDSNLFIGTYETFLEAINNRFSAGAKGILVLARIDNLKEVLSIAKEDGYNTMMKESADKMLNHFNNDAIYLYSSTTFALIFNETGRGTIFDYCEMINHYIKHLYSFNGKEIRFMPNLFVFTYPGATDSVNSFLRTVEVTLNRHKPDTLNKVYLVSQNVDRFASKTDYTYGLLEERYKVNNFELSALPIYHQVDKTLVGARLVIKLKDPLREEYIPTSDVYEVILKENKAYEYTNLLIKEISEFYNSTNLNLFRISGVSSFFLDLDSNYFLKHLDSYMDDLESLYTSLSYPKDFITFTLSEDDFFKNYDSLKDMPRVLESIGIKFILREYSGGHVGLEKLKELHISDVRLKTRLIQTIVNNPTSVTELTNITKGLEAYNISYDVNAVDTEDEVNILKDYKVNLVGGDYYSKELSLDDFIKYIGTIKK